MEGGRGERREEENHTKDVTTHRMAVPESKVFLYHTAASLALAKTGAGDKAWKVMTTIYTIVASANNYYVSYVPRLYGATIFTINPTATLRDR